MARLSVKARDGAVSTVNAVEGISVMENIRDLDASVDAICGGMCACATCHVYIDPAWQARLPARSYEEQVMLGDSPHYDAHRSRLACQIVVSAGLDGLELTVAPED